MSCMDCLVITGYALPGTPSHRQASFPNGTKQTLNLPVPPISPISSLSSISSVSSTQAPGANNMYGSHEETYMYKMQYALLEMDRRSEFVPNGQFLDLG